MDVIREDAARVHAVREAVGPDVELFIDANCNLDLYHATKLAEMVKPYGISFFEEPLTQNDVPGMARASPRDRHGAGLRAERGPGVPLPRPAAAREAIDYAQPNVAITGGFTQCVKIAGMAAAFNVSIANGGAWGFHNMHLQAGVANGTLVEHHYLAVELVQADLSRSAGADGRLFHHVRGAGARLRAQPRRDPPRSPSSRCRRAVAKAR